VSTDFFAVKFQTVLDFFGICVRFLVRCRCQFFMTPKPLVDVTLARIIRKQSRPQIAMVFFQKVAQVNRPDFDIVGGRFQVIIAQFVFFRNILRRRGHDLH